MKPQLWWYCALIFIFSQICRVTGGYGRESGSFTQWSAWSAWSDCTVTCGNGQQIRTRQCSTSGARCDGDATELKECGGASCATWGNWAIWSSCSTSCGVGVRQRSRDCQAYGGVCAGEKVETQACNAPPCCTQWSAWGSCSKSCGSGIQRRIQKCGIDGRRRRGAHYYGETTSSPEVTVREETASCNKFRCAQWDSWNSWSECSSPCHSKGSPAGRQTRERSCHTDESVCSISKNGYIPTTEQTPYSAITEDYYTIVPISGIATGYYSTLPTTTNVFYPNSPEFLDRMFGGTNAISVKVAKKAKRQVNPACACTGESTANQPCNDFICPYWSSWSSWSQCSQSCKALGGTAGTRIKSRSCVTDTTRCSTTTSHATTNIDVNVDVNVTVNGNHNSGKRTSVQKSLHTNDPNAHLSVATENSQSRRNRQAYVDSICSCDESSEGGSKVSEVCNDFFCPHYGDWQEWTSCSASCGRGTRNRSQTCIVDTNYCGRDKLANDQVCRCSPEVPPGQSDVCNSFSCPIWSDWSSWSSCTISCTQPNGAPGSHTKTRSCRTDPALQCRAGTEGNNSPTVNTNVDVNVNVNVNSDNSKNLKDRTASKNQPNSDEVEIPKQLQQDANTRSSQILSSRSRLRQIAQLEAIRRSKRQANDPCLCPGSDSITETCNAFNCPSFSDWGSWSSCSVSCGSGSRSQSRNCILDSNYCKTVTTATTTTTTDPICKCTGLTSQSETCVSEACPTYSEWSSWGVCSVTCGSNGQITRNRVCSRSDVPCAGSATESQTCAQGPCYSWGPWQSWSGDCQLIFCGGGSVNRTRKCPVEGGCPGVGVESSVCNQQACPDWGQWAEWSGCSATCAGGSRVRTRSCPLNDLCTPGNPYDVDPVKCNTQPCPAWTEWTQWGSCSASCGVGNRRRSRKCPLNDGCPGATDDVDPCSLNACPPVIPLSPWSECSKTCAGGIKTRSKTACAEGPPTCPIESETSPCNEQICPIWESWGPWSTCSKSCGSGQRTRTRGCQILNGCVGLGTEVDPLPCNAFGCPTRRKSL